MVGSCTYDLPERGPGEFTRDIFELPAGHQLKLEQIGMLCKTIQEEHSHRKKLVHISIRRADTEVACGDLYFDGQICNSLAAPTTTTATPLQAVGWIPPVRPDRM